MAIWENIEFWGILIYFIAVVSGIVLNVIIRKYQKKEFEETIKLQKEQNELVKKNMRFETTIKVFEMISGKINKNHRQRIFVEYCRLKKQNLSLVYQGEFKEDAYRLKESMNQAGVLFNADLLDKDVFLETYASYIIRNWNALEKDIEEQRKKI